MSSLGSCRTPRLWHGYKGVLPSLPFLDCPQHQQFFALKVKHKVSLSRRKHATPHHHRAHSPPRPLQRRSHRQREALRDSQWHRRTSFSSTSVSSSAHLDINYYETSTANAHRRPTTPKAAMPAPAAKCTKAPSTSSRSRNRRLSPTMRTAGRLSRSRILAVGRASKSTCSSCSQRCHD